jgi:hypothetical protein
VNPRIAQVHYNPVMPSMAAVADFLTAANAGL